MRRLITALGVFAALCFTQTSAFASSDLTDYKVLLTVGMDEVLPESPVVGGPEAYAEWQSTFGTSKTEQARSAAIAWYQERFGIDFTPGFYDPVTRITFLPNQAAPVALLIPISFEGNYRVLDSNTKHIPEGSKIHAFEWIVSFTPGIVGTNYGGTYAASLTTPPEPINPSDTFDYGVYRIHAKPKHKKHVHYNLFVRNFYPNRVEPVTDYPPRSIEWVQLFTKDFGPKGGCPGAGFLHLGVPLGPDASGNFPTFVRGTWTFHPGSTVLENLNGFIEAPF